MPRKTNKDSLPRLYHDLAGWFHLLTSPADYREEADFYRRVFRENCKPEPKTLLELGSGGGNNASHLKKYFKLTLTDLSEDMLAISRDINPDCEHIRGDMRDLRLGRQFDAVLVHDAVSFITTLPDLAKAIKTAFIHCRPGGAALFVPDYVRETFMPATSHGGHDGDGRALRYLEWIYDPDPGDITYVMDFAYLLKEGDKVTCENERHVMGLFGREEWRDMMKRAGFVTSIIERLPNWSPPGGMRVFLGIRPEK